MEVIRMNPDGKWFLNMKIRIHYELEKRKIILKKYLEKNMRNECVLILVLY